MTRLIVWRPAQRIQPVASVTKFWKLGCVKAGANCRKSG
jgi:hypothetical protein